MTNLAITPEELNALTAAGGTLHEVVEGERVVIDFPDTDEMLALISAIKGHPVLRKRLSINSKRVDGVNRLTLSK